MKLIIAEKKVLADQIIEAIGSQAKKINAFTSENGDYTVTFLGGHTLTHLMPEEIDESYKKWNLSALPIFFYPWKKKPIPEKKAIFSNVKELLKKADTVIHAGDMDDEGQLLVDEVLDYCSYKGEVKRLNTADTTPKALRKSLLNLSANNRLYGYSAEGRSMADLIFGFTLSRFFSIKTNTTLHIGRVKCPTLGLVYERDKLVNGFKSTTYYVPYFTAKSESDTLKVRVEFPKEDEILDITGYLTSREKAEKFIAEHNNGCFKGEIKSEKVTEKPPMPFNLAGLQLECEKIYGYTPAKTLEITQALRDKYNAISYNRSECEYLPESYSDDYELYITTRSNLSFSDEKNKFINIAKKENYKSKCFDSSKVQLHFAIIPQNVRIELNKLTEEERNVYIEIARRFLMQYMGDSSAEREILTIDLKKNRKAVAKSLLYDDLAWKKLLKERKLTEEEKTVINSNETTWFLMNGTLTEKQTKPADKYTEATLIADMTRISKYVKDPRIKELLLRKDEGKTGDKGSIGTSATRHTITTDLVKEGYLEKSGKGNKFLSITAKGKALYQLLPESCKTADITANWFIIQEEIAHGKATARDLAEKVKKDTIETMNNKNIDYKAFTDSAKTEKSYYPAKTAVDSCSCGGNIKESEKSWYCSTCKHVVSKEDKYFNAIGTKMTKTSAIEILKYGKVTIKAHSKTKDKDYTAELSAKFDESKKTPKGWIYPSYEFAEHKKEKK